MGKGYHTLTESGIHLSDGNIISEGLLLETVRELKELAKNKQDAEKFNKLCESAEEQLSDAERRILWNTVIDESSGNHSTIWDELVSIGYDLDIADAQQRLTEAGISFTEENFYEVYGEWCRPKDNGLDPIILINQLAR